MLFALRSIKLPCGGPPLRPVWLHYNAVCSIKIRNFFRPVVSKSGIMKLTNDKKILINLFLLFYLTVSPLKVNSETAGKALWSKDIYAQQSFPAVPEDATRIYYLDAENKLAPLPFEKGITSLNVHVVARDNRTSEVELSGPKATTTIKGPTPSFYVFVADRMDPPPHLLVRLKSKKNSRRFTITVIKGRKGYAPLNEENIRLDYRILERLLVEAGKGRILFINYMEIHPRHRLEPGEYAIIGDSLADIATFSIK